MTSNGPIYQQIVARLEQEFSPDLLIVRDDSANHIGHAGANPDGGESHFYVEIVSSHFLGQTKVARHQQVYKALGNLMTGRIHALSIQTRAPDEKV